MRRALAGRSPTVWLSCAIANLIRKFYTRAVLRPANALPVEVLEHRGQYPENRVLRPCALRFPSRHRRCPSSPRRVIRDDVPLDDIAAASWNALAGSQPFLSHAFLTALHDTGCASPATGWSPHYLTAWRDDALVGALPLYAKAHSYGEYVFDWGWADAYRRHGRRYYPKWVVAVPFTPVPGPRVLAPDAATRRALLEHAIAARRATATRRCTCCFRRRRKPPKARRWA